MFKFFSVLLACLIVNGALYAAAFEPLGFGARAQGMGGVFVAIANDGENIYWNPAGLAGLYQNGLNFSHQDLYGLGLLQYNSVGFVHPYLERGGIGFLVSQFSTGGEASGLDYQENTYIFSYGMRFFPTLFLGASGKYYGVKSAVDAGGLGLDLALLKTFAENKFSFGVLAQDVNRPRIRWDTGAADTLPSNLRIGTAYYFYEDNLISLELDKLLEKKIEPHLGIETQFFKKIVAFRFGGFKQKDGFNYALGFGLTYRGLHFDYAWERHYTLGDTSTFSVSLKWR